MLHASCNSWIEVMVQSFMWKIYLDTKSVLVYSRIFTSPCF
uniref:Uncharacterized protein n=1 Tax=Arundo donax TaxID=35708 RepID=A0A0A9BJI3_ARUDO